MVGPHLDLVNTPNFAAAKTPSGSYSFVFRISVDGEAGPVTINGFKLRTNRTLSLKGQTIQFIAKASYAAERAIIYPGLPRATCPAADQTTTYDGTWEFSFNVPAGTTKLELWDGEMDFGSADGTTKDSDDANTPANGVCVETGGTTTQCDPMKTDGALPNVPLWAQGTGAVAEGAMGSDPPDDNTNEFPGCLVTRAPSVKYRLLPPSDQATGFVNDNPSGTGEWEKFLISTEPNDADADHKPAAIEPGIWKLRLEGVDIYNQFSLHFTMTVIPPPTASLGDTVFLDTNANGIYEPGLSETGIPNVTVDLLQGDATCTNFSLLGTQTTSASGNYLFTGLPDGCYRVEVTDTNSVLTAFTKTTGPNPGANNNSQVNPYYANIVGQVDNLSADFGYNAGTDFCVPTTECANQTGPVGHLTASFDGSGNLIVKYEQALNVQDNTYGANGIGWDGRGFNALVGSDKAQFEFKDKNGVVVLSFYLDYISAKTGTPSGYASLGPDGGDGSMEFGNRAHLLSFNTSQARNLNDNGYCSAPLSCTFAGVNLLVNSPPADNNFVALNPAFVNFKFVNSYEMKIDKAAFGAAGFGTVGVPDQHNSPSKNGCNAMVAVPCKPAGQPGANCSVESVEFKLGGKNLEWKLKNTGTTDIVLTDIVNFAFPAMNGKVKRIKLDGDVLYDSTVLSSPVTLSESQFKASTDKRTFKKGETRRLIFEFETEIDKTAANYSGTVKIGTCEVRVFTTGDNKTRTLRWRD